MPSGGSAQGGRPATGGSNAGAAGGLGGRVATGGTMSTGGATGAAGAPSTGGVTATGGKVGTGGVAGAATGGAPPMGGAPGSGGMPAICGQGSSECVNSTQVRLCNAATLDWDPPVTCMNACVGNACGGNCKPTAKRCLTDTPQFCDNTGQWKDLATGACGPGLCSGGACLTSSHYGHTSGTGEVGAPPNTLLAIQIQIPVDGMLTGLGAVANQAAGQHLVLGLYTSGTNGPSALIKSTASITVAKGTNEASVAPTPITAGTYWIMENCDSTTFFLSDDQPVTYRNSTSTFGPLPVMINGSLGMLPGNAIDVYAIVAH
jgi:hypothetical protein